jgi:nuclear transport factor 2 (NTF2) superfamily protein
MFRRRRLDHNLNRGKMPMSRPPLPPFTTETAVEKTRLAEDAWNTRDPVRVALAYTTDSRWRNRAEFLQGREAIEAFLTRKWNRELDYRLIKESGLSARTALPFLADAPTIIRP